MTATVGATAVLAVATLLVWQLVSDGAEAPSDEVSQPAPSGVGNLLVYLVGHAGHSQRLVAYDVDAKRQLWSHQVRGDREFWAEGAMAGDSMVVSLGQSVSTYELNGSGPRDLFRLTDDTTHIDDVAVSPDGQTLALLIARGYEVPTAAPTGLGGVPAIRRGDSLVFMEIRTRQEIARVESGRQEFAGFAGLFGEVHWRDDGRGVLVSGLTQTESPGGLATVFVDGRIVVHDPAGYHDIAPNGRFASHGPGSLGCMAVTGHRLALRDLDSGRDYAVIEDDLRAFTGWEWSPDSSEYLFQSWPYRPGTDPADCSWLRGSPEWMLFRPGQQNPEKVDDPVKVYKRWYGDRLVELRCGSRREIALRDSWQNLFADCYDSRSGRSAQADLLVGGAVIDTADVVQVLGFSKP